jgi:hypothetical protein
MHITGTVQAYYRYCTGILKVLYRHITGTVQAYYRYCSGILQVLYWHVTGTVQISVLIISFDPCSFKNIYSSG